VHFYPKSTIVKPDDKPDISTDMESRPSSSCSSVWPTIDTVWSHEQPEMTAESDKSTGTKRTPETRSTPTSSRKKIKRDNDITEVVHIAKKKTECVVKTHDRSETFVLQGNIVIIHQSLLNSIFTTKLYILMKKINYKQR
jgi:hypothetical protein